MLIVSLNYRERDGRTPDLAAGESSMMSVHTKKINCDQSFFWGGEETNVLKKNLSVHLRIMMSDFIDEVSGFV